MKRLRVIPQPFLLEFMHKALPLSVYSGVKKLRADRIRPEQKSLRELQALWWRAVLRVSVVTVFIR